MTGEGVAAAERLANAIERVNAMDVEGAVALVSLGTATGSLRLVLRGVLQFVRIGETASGVVPELLVSLSRLHCSAKNRMLLGLCPLPFSSSSMLIHWVTLR